MSKERLGIWLYLYQGALMGTSSQMDGGMAPDVARDAALIADAAIAEYEKREAQ